MADRYRNFVAPLEVAYEHDRAWLLLVFEHGPVIEQGFHLRKCEPIEIGQRCRGNVRRSDRGYMRREIAFNARDGNAKAVGLPEEHSKACLSLFAVWTKHDNLRLGWIHCRRELGPFSDDIARRDKHGPLFPGWI